MGSFLLAGILRLLRGLTKSHAPPSQSTTKPPQKSPESYRKLLAAALSPEHPLHIRHQFPNQLVHELLASKTQFVKFSSGDTLESNHEPVFIVDDVIRASSPASAVTTVLNDCQWDSGLVQTGFDWTASSVWYIPLDISLLSFDVLDRHLRLVATLSSPESCAVLLFPMREVIVDGLILDPPFEDMQAFMKLSGFDVESVQTLADLSDEQFPQYEDYMNAMSVAVVRPAARGLRQPPLDNISEVTYTSNDISSQTASTEFEDYLSLDRRLVRFELDIAALPPHLAASENQVVVIGSETCVGCWDPRYAKRMMGRIDVPGTLVADVSVSVLASDMEYKYAVVRGDEVIEWEVGSNRCLYEDMKITRDEWRYS